MVRTRWLRQTLGEVIWRVLGTKVSGDADEASQRRRLTTSPCRQREATPVVKDIEYVDWQYVSYGLTIRKNHRNQCISTKMDTTTKDYLFREWMNVKKKATKWMVHEEGKRKKKKLQGYFQNFKKLMSAQEECSCTKQCPS